MNKYEVYYTYCVDASMVVDADSPQDAEIKVEQMWSEGKVAKEKLADVADFEILNVRRR